MKKFLFALMMCLFITATTLSGCNLVTRNDAKYAMAIVATIDYSDGTSDTITRKELISAYNSYGTTYTENTGSVEQGFEQTLETLIDRKLIIKAVYDYYEGVGQSVFTEGEKYYLYKSTYEAIENNIKTYYENKFGTIPSKEDTSDTAIVETDYVKNVTLEIDSEDNYYLKNVSTSKTIRQQYAYITETVYDYEYQDDNKTYVYKEKMYDNILKLRDSSTNYTVAFSEYVKACKSSEEGLGYSTDEKSVFMREMDRIYGIVRDNYLVEKYEDIYSTQTGEEAIVSSVSVRDIVSAYKVLVQNCYNTYNENIENSSSYNSDMLSNISDMWYMKNDGSTYFTVSSIFVSYGDLQTEIDALDNMEYEKKNDALNNIRSRIEASERVNGVETGNKINLNTLYNNLLVSGNLQTSFNNAIYSYSDSDTYKNADYNEVFGIDSNGEILSTRTDEEILNAIKKLYNNYLSSGTRMSEVVYADDGAYIFYFERDLKEVFTLDIDSAMQSNGVLSLSDNEIINYLNNTLLNTNRSKSLLDVIYEEVKTDNFSTFQELDLNKLKNADNCTISTNSKNYTDLYQ